MSVHRFLPCHHSAFIFIALIQFALPALAFADQAVCVHDVPSFNSALGTAKASKQLTAIKIETGTYQLDAIDATFNAPVVIAGGYLPGTNCAQRSANADATVLDFAGKDVSLNEGLYSPSYALIKLDGLTMRHGRALTIVAGEFKHPLYLGQDDFPGQIRIVRTHITGFTGGSTFDNAAIGMQVYNGAIAIVDSLFDHLGGGTCAVSIFPMDDNTIHLNHVTMDLGGGRDFCLSDSGDNDDWNYTIDNSIIWASDGTLSAIRGLNDYDDGKYTHVTINNTLFKGYVGSGDVTINHQLSGDPHWVDPATRNYHLQTAPKSPAINAGTTQVSGGEPTIDINGDPRQVGSAPDLGAYESPANDASTFTVTNTNDSGAGSLREAMTQANASSSAVTGILFDIRDKSNTSICPAVIAPQSPLPDVLVPMQIEGYSQGGSVVNTDAEAFNGHFCVVVQPGGAFSPVGTGFHVPAGATNASLTLTGVAIGAFWRGVSLQGGYGHMIVGNQFGGLINEDTYQLNGSSSAALYVSMDSIPAQVQIGGDDPALRNVFQSASTNGLGFAASAIFIGTSTQGAGTSCQINGNLIGVSDDGMAPVGNDYGLMLEGSNCIVQGNRIAGNSHDAIWINGGNGNVVRNNVLGLLAYGLNFATVNHGVGIRVEGDHNVIGGSVFDAPVIFENTIENFDGPGIVVAGGTANTLRGNTVVYNNAAVASDLEIDIAEDGPTANDINDADGGPNLRQNFPILHGTAWSVLPKPGDSNVTATLSGTLRSAPGPGFYQIDAYASDNCDPITGRGAAQTYIGGISYVYVPPGANIVKFSMPVTLPTYQAAGNIVSVTATNNSNGDYSTSEIGKCFNTDTIFADGSEAE